MGRKKKNLELTKNEENTLMEGSLAPESEQEICSVVVKPSEEETKELRDLLKQAEKKFGEGFLVPASDIPAPEKVTTKNLLLDILTEGGLPKGSISLFYGDESSGKSFQALLCASVFTSNGIPIAYICTEGDVDTAWAKKLGNDLQYFHIARPDTLEKAIDITDILVRSKKFGLIIVDSVTAGVPQEAIDKEVIKDQMALQARRNGKLCQKLTSGLQPINLANPDTYNNTVVILIAHLREKVGVLFGNPETLPGGHSLRHHASYIVRFKKGQALTQKDTVVGREMKIKIEKAKFSKPLVSGTVDLLFTPPSLNNVMVLLTYASQTGIIRQAGPYYEYGELKAQGKEAFLNLLKEENKLTEIKHKIIEVFNEK